MALDDAMSPGDLAATAPERLARILREGWCPPDSAFDGFLPEDLEELSSDQWTPLEVVLTVSRWLEAAQVRRVVDIGAGPGKFCIAAALAGSFELIGVEQNPRFVAVARALARLFEVEHRVRFVHGTLSDAVVPRADAYYLYNPFAQHLFAPPAAPGEISNYERYRRDVMITQTLFRSAPAGTIVVTYNGFGGLMPASYEVRRLERELPCVLRMWKKADMVDAPGYAPDAD